MARTDDHIAALGLRGPIFVVGCPRSGTTLLQQLLNNRADVVIAPETHFVRRYAARFPEACLHDDRRWRAFVDDVVATPEFGESAISEAEFRSLVKAGPRTPQAVLAAWLAVFGRTNGSTWVGEKTPNHQLHIPQLVRWFPDARFIAITRDPRAVVLSTRDVWWSAGSARGDARAWRRFWLALRAAPASAIIHRVRYESMVADPDRIFADLLEAIGVSPRSVTRAPANPVGLNTAREPWKARSGAAVTTARVQAWRSELTPAQIRDVEAVSWRGMRAEGYELTHRAVQLAPRASLEEALRLGRHIATRISGIRVHRPDNG